jgi:hypothetical protein
MKPLARQSGRHLLNGVIWVFLAEALVLPTGVVTAAFLTRKLGLQGYGLFTLAVMVVGWSEWTITSLFAHATVKLVSETKDWQPVADSGNARRLAPRPKTFHVDLGYRAELMYEVRIQVLPVRIPFMVSAICLTIIDKFNPGGV